MKKVIELIRVSTEVQAASDRASIPAQRTVNARTAATYGLEIARTIAMADVSGACVLKAPEMQELLRLIEDPAIHGVVAREFSRLMRPENFDDFELLQRLADTGTMLYLPDGPIDLSSKMGRVLGAIRAAFAGMERSETLERIWTAREEKRRRGELGASEVILPFGVGYNRAERKFFYKPEAERMREVFRQFLGGEHSYQKLAEIVGLTPRGLALLMRNTIWTGVRTIDKKRDLSAAGRYSGVNGRQAGRRKIARAPEEIIRVRVIDQPLISDEDFQRAQAIMDLKQKKHWRSCDDYDHRFTYNGFMTCSACGEPIHTCHQRKDYYVCRSRRLRHTCSTLYMARERLEPRLDMLLTARMAEKAFLSTCLDRLIKRASDDGSAARIRRLKAEIERLKNKRTKVADSFCEGVYTLAERNARFAAIDRDLRTTHETLAREAPNAVPTVAELANALAPLSDWNYLSREHKRRLLTTLVPDIRLANYEIESLGINLPSATKCTQLGRDSWRRPA